MAMPSLLLILLLLSSLHACNARRLQLFESSNSVSRLELSPISQGFRTDQLDRSFDKISTHKVSSSIEIGVEILKGLKKHKRSAMEVPMKGKEKVVSFEENEVGEDMVVMDYAQPHRKPPIHNEKQP